MGTVQGAQHGRAMVTGRIKIDNRQWKMGLGWYGLHVGALPLEYMGEIWCERMKKVWPDAPPESALPSSMIVGLIHINEHRTPEQCPGKENIQSVWAVGPICHIIDQAIMLKNPVRHRGNK